MTIGDVLYDNPNYYDNKSTYKQLKAEFNENLLDIINTAGTDENKQTQENKFKNLYFLNLKKVNSYQKM